MHFERASLIDLLAAGSRFFSLIQVKTVTPQTSMREAAAIMSELKLHRLPVVDDKGTLVGVLSSADVMKDLLHIVRNLPPAASVGEETDELDASP
jgi:CBS domain-containing protein